MAETSARRFPRFSTRGLLFLIVLIALAFGWFSSLKRADRERLQQEQRLRYAEEELRRAKDELRDQMRRSDHARSFGDLEGSNLAGLTIVSSQNALHRASFRNCRLDGAILKGGVSSFQLARFDAAKLAGAHLKGGGASFQAASFVGADLTGATLTGGATSFQGASFEEAILIGSKLTGNFQGVNISGAKFEAADLTGIAGNDLGSCYFKDAPTYDARTKFPMGFDPVERLWKRVE